ncbi:hypothetical protein B0O99DRAFT_560133 [Bisporella sp. PMI_857]|nr:hypothetical protein B0O99DRAFT_560133 [Bisporella sp. PMI_857]
MASHVVVISTSFQRVRVNVNPGTHMADILAEACKTFGPKFSNYGFKHNNKLIDMSRKFRETNLTSGAKLELVIISKSPLPVSVALQLPDERLVDSVGSDTSLWQILRRFESKDKRKYNFTERAVTSTTNGKASGSGQLLYEQPILNILGKEVSNLVDLQKTLSQFGVNSGNVLIRLTFQKTERTFAEAAAEIDEYFKETTMETATDRQPGITHDTSKQTDSAQTQELEDQIEKVHDARTNLSTQHHTPTTQNTETPPSMETTGQASVHSEQNHDILGPNGRPIKINKAPSGNTPTAAREVFNEMDYEPTKAHALSTLSRLQSESQNKRLLSDAELGKLEQEKLAKINATRISIKVRFPDQTSMTTPFESGDSAADLYTAVAGVIAAPNQPFILSTYGVGDIPKDANKKLILDLKFSGNVMINFRWVDGVSQDIRTRPALKAEYAEKAVDLVVPTPANDGPSEEASSTLKEPDKKKESGGKGKGLGALKKFLPGGKK